MFGLKNKTALEEAEPPPRDLEAEALGRVRAAEDRVARARAALEKFRAEHYVTIDGRLGIITPGTWTREEVDREDLALMREHDEALKEFHGALGKWSQLKKRR